MALTVVLLTIGGLIGFAAWVWLLVAAFRVGIGWGLLIFLLSWTWIPVIIFAIRYWKEAKRPLMLWGVGFVFSMAAMLIAIFALGMDFDSIIDETDGLIAQPAAETESEESILPRPRPTAQPTHPSWEAVVREIDRDKGDTWEALVPSPTPITGRPGEGWLRWDELTNHIGHLMVVELKNSTVMTTAMEAVEPDRLRVRHVIGGGEASYWIERSQVDRIRRAD